MLVQVRPVPDGAIGDFRHEIVEAGHQVRGFWREVEFGAKLLAALAEVLAGHGEVPWDLLIAENLNDKLVRWERLHALRLRL